MEDHIVTFNAGSSSVKFGLFAVGSGAPRPVASGQAQGLGSAPTLAGGAAGGEPLDLAFPNKPGAPTHDAAVAAIVAGLARWRPDLRVVAIGHRIVHGGLRFAAPVRLDDAVLDELRALIPLAPLHQPHNLAAVAAARAAFPQAPQVGCFDTAFHRGHAFAHDAYALPRAYYEQGLRRFGFHGLSYEFIARRLREAAPQIARGRVIVAHLGAGASLCAIEDGRSIATTMGFSPLDGLPMATRCGEIDPGLLLYLMQHEGLSADALAHLLYEESGLKGLSGLTGDMRALQDSDDPRARAAIDYYVTRIVMEIGALTAALGGLDALVFTAGVGENSARIRAEIAARSGWLDLRLDAEANARNAAVISTADATLHARVMPTDEEAMIAQHTIETLWHDPRKREPISG